LVEQRLQPGGDGVAFAGVATDFHHLVGGEFVLLRQHDVLQHAPGRARIGFVHEQREAVGPLTGGRDPARHPVTREIFFEPLKRFTLKTRREGNETAAHEPEIRNESCGSENAENAHGGPRGGLKRPEMVQGPIRNPKTGPPWLSWLSYLSEQRERPRPSW